MINKTNMIYFEGKIPKFPWSMHFSTNLQIPYPCDQALTVREINSMWNTRWSKGFFDLTENKLQVWTENISNCF